MQKFDDRECICGRPGIYDRVGGQRSVKFVKKGDVGEKNSDLFD